VGRFKPNFACGRTLVPDVSSPLLGVSGPRLAEKGENEIFVTIGANGGFVSVLLTHLFLLNCNIMTSTQIGYWCTKKSQRLLTTCLDVIILQFVSRW